MRTIVFLSGPCTVALCSGCLWTDPRALVGVDLVDNEGENAAKYALFYAAETLLRAAIDTAISPAKKYLVLVLVTAP